MTDQERIERAYRLAFPGMERDPARIALTLSGPDEAFDRAGWACPASNRLNWAILALALLPEGGGTLGRWTAYSRPASGRVYGFEGRGAEARLRHCPPGWEHALQPGAYLDGTAQELLLLMCAADELARREVQP